MAPALVLLADKLCQHRQTYESSQPGTCHLRRNHKTRLYAVSTSVKGCICAVSVGIATRRL